MSDLKRKASSERDASEEPNAKRHRSNQDLNTLTQDQVINSADAWNSTEEVIVIDDIPAQSVSSQEDSSEEVTVIDGSPAHSVSTQDAPAHDDPAQEAPAQVPTQVTPAQQIQSHVMPSQGVPVQAVAASNNDKESKAKPESTEPNSNKSARQLRIESLADPGQNVRERGTVRKVDGDLRWQASDGTLVPCVYHNSIRAELIAKASHNSTLSYDIPRRHGNLGFNATDVTAYHPEQKTWSRERNLWPNIRDNILNRLERKGYKELYANQDPGKMMHNGRLVVDHDNHPVYIFPDLPLTLSTAIEGWWLEAVTRLDSRIDRMDIRARLPAFRAPTRSNKESKLYGLSAIGNKRLRFRWDEGLIAWDSRIGSDAINQFYKARLPAGCVERNTTEGGGPISPGEKKHAEGINGGKPEHADKAKGRTKANAETPSPESAPGPSSAQNFGNDSQAPKSPSPASGPSIPPHGQQPQIGAPIFGAPGAHTPGFSPQIRLSPPSNEGTSANIPIPRGLTPAQVLGQYQFLSGLTGTTRDDFEAAIEAINDEANAYAAMRPADNNRVETKGDGTRGTNEVTDNASQQRPNVQVMTRVNEYVYDPFPQTQDVQQVGDVTTSNKYITDRDIASPATNLKESAAAAPEHQQSQAQQEIIHNTIGDGDWVPNEEIPSEEIDEAFWEEFLNKGWSPAGGQVNDQTNLEDAQPGFYHVEALDAIQPGAEQNDFTPDPLFDPFAPTQDAQLEPIQPGAGQDHFSSDPLFDPFAPTDDDLVPAQQELQVEAPQAWAGLDDLSSDPLFDHFDSADDNMVPELTPKEIQEMVAAFESSGDFANRRSLLLDQGLPGEPLARAETTTTSSKRKAEDQEPRNGNKKVRLEEDPTDYSSHKFRQDRPSVPMQHPQPRKNYQRLPAYVSSGPAASLGKGCLPTPTATPEKPSTPRSTTPMPPPRHQQLPPYRPSKPPLGGNSLLTPGVTPEISSTPQPTPSSPPQRRQTLPPYQSLIPRLPATNNIPSQASPTPPNTTTPDPPTSQPTTPSHPPPPSSAPIDHRYSLPTNPEQCALIITLLQPTVAQFRDLMQGTPYADHIVHTDMVASYMAQHEHIMRELELLWGRMNWDRANLPRLSVAGPIDGARWFGC